MIANDLLTKKKLAIHLEDGRIEIQPASEDQAASVYLSPGWLDIQVNGFAGHDINSPDLCVDDVRAITMRLWQEGVTSWCPTLITAPADQIEHNLEIIRSACDQDILIAHCIAGIHLEGPYISSLEGTRGAHPLEYIHPPVWDEFQRWQTAAGGRIRIVTLAPELPGSHEFIRHLTSQGVLVALGHTRATTNCIHEAVVAGARLSTHLGNGIETSISRHPNPIWDQLAENRMSASLIFDGFHLPTNVMKVFLKAKGLAKCLLVSDSVALGGLEPGIYSSPVGSKVQLHENGRLSLYGTEYLAGSASSLKKGVENAVHLAGINLTAAIRLVAVNPAKLLNWNQAGRTLFRFDHKTGQATILATVVDRQVVYQNQDSE